MYIPHLYNADDQTELLDFMKRFSFATIVTAHQNEPAATHLPFLVSEHNGQIILTSHFAKANTQWRHIETGIALVIFSEPHAYISPSHYEKELNVPTWNYIAVHAYGTGTVVSDTARTFEILERTIDTYEEAYRTQWNTLPPDYKTGMANGIVAFEITVTDIQGKKKLSQNKTENEQQRIIDTLSHSSDSNERIIAEYMQQNLFKK